MRALPFSTALVCKVIFGRFFRAPVACFIQRKTKTCRTHQKTNVARRACAWKDVSPARAKLGGDRLATNALQPTRERLKQPMVNGQPCMPHWAACLKHRCEKNKRDPHSVYRRYITLGKLNARNCGNIEFQKSVSTATTSHEVRPFNTEICEQSIATIFWVANASMPFWLPNQIPF